MTSSDKQSPRVYENGDKLCSDICVWCGAKEGLSESHLFPKCIGGSFAARISCQECNSFLGTKFESEAKKNASITAALVKLGIADRRSAYRLGKKLDTESGVEMHIAADGKSKPVTRQVSDNRFEGSPEQNKAFALRHFRKTRPKWSTKPLEEFYDDPSKQKFTYAGEQYTKKHYPAGVTELAVQMQRHPHPNLIFKIIYEFLALFNLQSSNMIQSTLEHLVTVDANNRKDRIVFSEDVAKRLIPNTGDDFAEYRNLEDIPFAPFHYIQLRLSCNLTLYVEVVLFGQLQNLFVLGRLDAFDDKIMLLIDQVFFFPVGDSSLFRDRYPNVKLSDQVQSDDARVEYRLTEIE